MFSLSYFFSVILGTPGKVVFFTFTSMAVVKFIMDQLIETWSWAENGSYIDPSVIKKSLLHIEWADNLSIYIYLLCYSLIFMSISWALFMRKDL